MTSYELLQGACDVHLHAAPSMFARVADAMQVAEQARDSGMRAIVLKNHHDCSMGRARMVKKTVSDIEIFGSIVLNYPVGGLNLFAVDSAIKLGAKIIFMPTLDSKNHINFYGVGQYGSKMKLTHSVPKAYQSVEGISIFKDGGELDPALLDILELIAESDVALATSHLSPSEVERLVEEAVKAEVKKIIVNHVNFEVSRIPIEEQIRLVGNGVFMEHVFMSLMPPWHCVKADQMVENIKRVGVEHSILSSDCGRLAGPTPVEGLRILYQLLLEYGISEKEIEIMSSRNPAKLMNI